MSVHAYAAPSHEDNPEVIVRDVLALVIGAGFGLATAWVFAWAEATVLADDVRAAARGSGSAGSSESQSARPNGGRAGSSVPPGASTAVTTWQQGRGWSCHRCATQVRVGEIHLCTNQKQGGLRP